MCFYDGDYDWIARDIDSFEVVASSRRQCDDCYRPIQPGDVCLHMDLHEYELCPKCSYRHQEGDECSTEEDLGESSELNRCMACVRFREAIRAVELSRGCSENESEPFGSIREGLDGIRDPEAVAAYLGKACDMFPDLAPEFESVWGKFR